LAVGREKRKRIHEKTVGKAPGWGGLLGGNMVKFGVGRKACRNQTNPKEKGGGGFKCKQTGFGTYSGEREGLPREGKEKTWGKGLKGKKKKRQRETGAKKLDKIRGAKKKKRGPVFGGGGIREVLEVRKANRRPRSGERKCPEGKPEPSGALLGKSPGGGKKKLTPERKARDVFSKISHRMGRSWEKERNRVTFRAPEKSGKGEVQNKAYRGGRVSRKGEEWDLKFGGKKDVEKDAGKGSNTNHGGTILYLAARVYHGRK